MKKPGKNLQQRSLSLLQVLMILGVTFVATTVVLQLQVEYNLLILIYALSAVAVLHELTHLPVIVDPSHACGHAWMVPELAKAAVAAGADGLMIEVHNNPAKAKCDGAQSLTPDQFDELMQFIGKEVEFFGKKMN